MINSDMYISQEYAVPSPLYPSGGEMTTAPYDGVDPEFSLTDAERAEQFALNMPEVLGARAFTLEGRLTLAVITLPFYLKSERDAFKASLTEALKEGLGAEDVTVTFSIEVYRKITEDMSEDAMRRLEALAKSE